MIKRSNSQAPKPWRRRVKSVSNLVAEGIYRSLGSELSLSLADRLRKGDYSGIIASGVNPLDYDDPIAFRDDYLACELMSKFPSWELGIDREQVAIEKFRQAEKTCLEANHRLIRPLEDTVHGTTSLEAYIFVARGKIRSLLRSFSWDRCSQHFGHGPGGTYSSPRKRGDSYYKFGDKKPTTTKACLGLAYSAICQVPTWFRHVSGYTGELTPAVHRELASYMDEFFSIVDGNKVITVPKNAKTDRTIAKEPLMNQYIQKGIGGEIRRKLKLVGINLDDQTSNQRLALDGSVHGTLATMDLSMASDSVSMELVRLLLPDDWVTAIEQCRSPIGVLPSGEKIYYQKVSSMGNGFTFELEALIFWALVSAVIHQTEDAETRVGVYGDDLIFSSTAYGEVERLLEACGFTPNAKKSFSTGPFRESCGKHYFLGLDVTPFYIREDVDSAESYVLCANSIRHWAFRRHVGWSLDARMYDIHTQVVGMLPKGIQQLRGPAVVTVFDKGRKEWVEQPTTSGCLIGDWDECRPHKAPRGVEGWIGESCLPSNRTRRYADLPFLTRGLYLVETGKEGLNEVSDHSRAEYRRRKILYQWWPSRGPWV